jgi:SAM-dependent methyltransferase
MAEGGANAALCLIDRAAIALRSTMPPSAEEQALLDRCAGYYRHAMKPVLVEIERAVCGCDYGSTSWTTRAEAGRLAQMLALAPGRSFLDIGSGSGWPALYLARITGCNATLTDVPVEGLVLAAKRAAADGVGESCRCVAGNAIALPFAGGTFDAIGHSDVLCCLQEKLAALKECRRTIRNDGRMAFTVISIAPGLSAAEYARAADAGPPFKETTAPYTVLLERSGWRLVDRLNLTAEYTASVSAMLREEEARLDRLAGVFGEVELAERMARRRRTVEALEDELLLRELFYAVPKD